MYKLSFWKNIDLYSQQQVDFYSDTTICDHSCHIVNWCKFLSYSLLRSVYKERKRTHKRYRFERILTVLFILSGGNEEIFSSPSLSLPALNKNNFIMFEFFKCFLLHL